MIGRRAAMPLGTDYARQDCSLARSLEVVGERWTLLILRDASSAYDASPTSRPTSTSPEAVLSARLDALVADGLLTRTGHRTSGVRAHRGGARALAGAVRARPVGRPAYDARGAAPALPPCRLRRPRAGRPLRDLRTRTCAGRHRDPARARRRPDAARRPRVRRAAAAPPAAGAAGPPGGAQESGSSVVAEAVH